MPRHPKTSGDVSRSARRDFGEYSYEEVASVVANYFCAGKTMSEIRTRLAEEPHRIVLRREDPWQLVSYAATRGRIRYIAPFEHELEERIRERSFGVDVRVVLTGLTGDVSQQVATQLLSMIRSLRLRDAGREEIHIGFAGGRALGQAARILADLVRHPPYENLPKRLVFHAMIAAFNTDDPAREPNSFFTYLADDTGLPFKTGFVGLQAPGMVDRKTYEVLRELPEIRAAFEEKPKIDIVVMSAGGHWQGGHSTLYRIFEGRCREALEILKENGCVGDCMWQPVGEKGPLKVETPVFPLTLMALDELPGLIRQGKKVLLAISPCGRCGGPKEEVARIILDYHEPLISHLIIDSRSARGLLAAPKLELPKQN